MQGFGLQIKPAGNNCNLKCKYCYAAPFAKSCIKIMPLDILETAIKKIYRSKVACSSLGTAANRCLPELIFLEAPLVL